ncbi:MAG TPA: dipeptidase [Ignavibacteria bacterium]|nr:dipeptidase [Ignavibacteria bacterium]
MKILILAFVSAILFLKFACFTSESDKKISTKTDSPMNTINRVKKDTIINKFNNLDEDAFALHYDAIVIDTHNDILMPVFLEGADISKNNPHTQSDFVKWKKGGLDVQVFSIYVPERYKSGHFKYVMKLIDEMERYASDYSDIFALCKNYTELQNGLASGKMCGLMGSEGGNMVEGSMDNLVTLYDRGVRYLGLTWNTSNAIGTSARDENERGKKGGLTEFGFDVVKKMDEMGMLIDVSHLGETAFWDVLQTSKNPIIASHSAVYSICPHYRNLSDEQIKAIAKTNGYIGVNFYCKFLDPSVNSSKVKSIHSNYKNGAKNIDSDDLIEFNKQRYDYMTNNRIDGGTPVDVLIDHIDYIVKLVGIDYVGLGSDFDGGVYSPNEIYDATCYPIITKKLVERGYKEEEIRKILGLNFLRVFKQVSP